ERPALVVVIGFERLGQVRDVVGPVVVVADEKVVDGGHLRSARAAAVLARGRIQSGDRGVGGIGQFPTGLRVAVFSAAVDPAGGDDLRVGRGLRAVVATGVVGGGAAGQQQRSGG